MFSAVHLTTDIAKILQHVRFRAPGSTGRRNTGVKSLCWGFQIARSHVVVHLADEPLCSVDHLIGVREHAGRYKAASPARHEIDCKPGSTAAGLTRSERHAATGLQNSIRGALDSRPSAPKSTLQH